MTRKQTEPSMLTPESFMFVQEALLARCCERHV